MRFFHLFFILTPFCDIMFSIMAEGVFVMKRVFTSFVVCMVSVLCVDFASATTSRLGVSGVASSGRMPSIPVSTVGIKTASNLNNTPPASMGRVESEPEQEQISEPEEQPVINMREKEREACIRNNIGVGNTFVWASRYSDLGNYSTMIEDIEKPDNNACFVRVELKSSDSRIDMGGFPGKYFEMGQNITCGSWADEGKIEQLILDAKKKGRTWATIGGAVGGAALGVGAMEWFGNDLIDGAVQGQQATKNLSQNELLRSQLLVLKSENKAEFDSIMKDLAELRDMCAEDKWVSQKPPKECSDIDYAYLLASVK